jgi:hypothetical protein
MGTRQCGKHALVASGTAWALRLQDTPFYLPMAGSLSASASGVLACGQKRTIAHCSPVRANKAAQRAPRSRPCFAQTTVSMHKMHCAGKMEDCAAKERLPVPSARKAELGPGGRLSPTATRALDVPAGA